MIIGHYMRYYDLRYYDKSKEVYHLTLDKYGAIVCQTTHNGYSWSSTYQTNFTGFDRIF